MLAQVLSAEYVFIIPKNAHHSAKAGDIWQRSCLCSAVVERARQPFKPGSWAPDSFQLDRVVKSLSFAAPCSWVVDFIMFYSNLNQSDGNLTAIDSHWVYATPFMCFAEPQFSLRILCHGSPCWVLDEPLPNLGLDWGLVTVNTKLSHIATQAMIIMIMYPICPEPWFYEFWRFWPCVFGRQSQTHITDTFCKTSLQTFRRSCGSSPAKISGWKHQADHTSISRAKWLAMLPRKPFVFLHLPHRLPGLIIVGACQNTLFILFELPDSRLISVFCFESLLNQNLQASDRSKTCQSNYIESRV